MKLNKKHLVAILSVLSLSIIVVPLLTSCTGDIPELNPAEIINTLFPNVWVFIAQVIAMCVVFSLVLWLVWKPTNKMLDKRREYIAKEITDAENAKQEALQYLENAKSEHLAAQAQTLEIIAKAKSESLTLRESLEKEAREAADKIISSAKISIANERRENLERLQSEAREAAYIAAEALMKKELSREDNDKLVDQFIKELENNEK
ncbi:F0F1 ATP synthase subunit B [Ureaplasma parvum]|uniref:ATP synthase subunit b n=3 Tax=Ureaplasma parvum TaxID=134821 RepID=ATPF_UREPA|nr:F0F1 ATP synthase subunit B [Ureaplasma parvum]B1AIC4.1 RecName: Full=ATP synthase subunit b; AltName: Full=ATP synthase F(0) sector subunit b; AltName: Full=ATPase subunit I; AltName: Full=F-type ATPase subunit b; Short=F-ATPase subunit b; Flags: Precursor [Ureaplasma parvum serovar 3 str. ATCC 27815]Q9PR09.1 RecName: Full=ATP synthase subunit b; AltName: Full=ATP synthase F(0) sector subunit b; AltName: Full=ATPase subunit I; AltName: Full=F-type ATPase subunit b; Short=F-ATPase subunit b; F